MSKIIADYTTDMLTKNFETIDRALVAMGRNIDGLVANEGAFVETLQINLDYLQRLEGRIQALENIRLVVRAPRGSRLFLITACAASAYAGYKYALKKVDEWDGSRHQEYMKSRVDHPAGSKMNINVENPTQEQTNDNPEN
jgi:hypothetical protein